MRTGALFLLPWALCFVASPARSSEAVDPTWDSRRLFQAEVWPPVAPGLRIRPWILPAVRARTPFRAHLEIYHDGPRGSRIRVDRLRVRHGDSTLVDVDTRLELVGDGGIYADFSRLAEVVPPGESKRYAHRTLPPDVHRGLDRDELEGALMELDDLGRRLAEVGGRGGAPPLGQIGFVLDPSRFLGGAAGDSAELELTVDYVDGRGVAQVGRLKHTLRRLPDFPRLPLAVGGTGAFPDFAPEGEWYTGDLHVHSCKDETGFWRGCPECQAEFKNWGVENDLASLKSQFVAMGASWFSSSSHSYCLARESEYERLRGAAAALSRDGEFLVVPDTELSSFESGEEGCPDLADALCLLTGGTMHLGAHFIESWKPGGTSLILGICANPMEPVLENIASVREEGGLSIVNHPCPLELGSTFNSNSDDVLTGLEANGLTGAEIWNGPQAPGQGGHARWWTRRLLEGKRIFAYSGSDTHDDVVDHGWNHVFVWPRLTLENLRRSVQRGLVYLSDYQYLVIAIRRPGEPWVPMGAELRVPRGGGEAPVMVAVSYDMGDRRGSVELWRGRVGDAEETLVDVFEGLEGDGTIWISDAAPLSRGSYYRAYSEAPGLPRTGTAYSNPVWVSPR